MYFLLPHLEKKRLTGFQLRQKGQRFLEANAVKDMSALLACDEASLLKFAEKPIYTQWSVPKPTGGRRLIESPHPALKGVQKALSGYLQAVYYTIRPDNVFGAVVSPLDEAKTRNIYTNAERHIGKKWVLNVDIHDFFPNITREKVFHTFSSAPFLFEPKLAQWLAAITTHENRLPQGAPASPIIANLVCWDLDKQLQKTANANKWTYTRYIDDITISSDKGIKEKEVQQILDIVTNAGFEPNTDKVSLTKSKNEPVVTGLILGPKKPDVDNKFAKDLARDMDMYLDYIARIEPFSEPLSAEALQQMHRSLVGRLAFLRFVRGQNHKSCIRLSAKLGMFTAHPEMKEMELGY